MNVNTINDLEKVIIENNILQKYNLVKIGVYGSFARGEINFNDIDLYIDQKYSLSYAKNLKDELEKLLNIKVDIMLKEYADPAILYYAEKDMKYITENSYYKKSDLVYLLRILQYIGKLNNITASFQDAESLFNFNNQTLFDSSLVLLIQIGENVSKIDDSLKQEYPDIDWQKIKDFRNKLVHDYISVNIIIVYEIIKNDLAKLKFEIEKIIKEKVAKNIFSIELLKICKGNIYYNFVDFDKLL